MLVFLFLGHRYPPVVETTDFPVPAATERSTMDTVCSQALLVPSGSLPQVTIQGLHVLKGQEGYQEATT